MVEISLKRKGGFLRNLKKPTIKKLKELNEDEENALERNIVWIFGSPRSGTSWFALQLLSYQTHSINEPHITEHLATQVGAIKHANVRRIDHMRDLPDYFFSKQYEKTWLIFLRKLILNRVYVQVMDTTKKIVIKEPGSLGAGDIISKCLPNSKIIIILRDGRDIIDSLLDARQKEGFMTKQAGATPISETDRLIFIETHAKRLVTMMENCSSTFQNHDKNLRYKIKYEDLRKNTLEELKKVYQFLEIDISEEELQTLVSRHSFENIPEKNKGKGKFARSASPGKWKENLTEEEKSVMEKVMTRMLTNLGYE